MGLNSKASRFLSGLASITLLAVAGLTLQSPAKASFNTSQVNPILTIDPTGRIDPTGTCPGLEGCFEIGTNPTDPLRSFGYEFQVKTPLIINALGVFDASGAGVFNDAHVSRIWLSSDPTSPLRSISFAAKEMCATVTFNFCWKEIAQLTLSPGFYTVAADNFGPLDGYAVGGKVIEQVPNAAIWTTFLANTAPDYNLMPPADSSITSTNFDLPVWGANVSYTVPAPLPVLGAAAGFGWSRRLRQRIKAAS